MRSLRSTALRVLRAVWRARHALPVTVTGLLLGGVGAYLALALAAKQTDYVLRAAGLVALGAVGLSLVLVLAAALRLWLTLRRWHGRQGDGLWLQTGMPADTGLRLPSLRGWPLLQLRLLWEQPGRVEVTLRRQGAVLAEQIRPRSRGESRRVRRRVMVEDIFGFARLGLPLHMEQVVRITPARAPMTAHVVTRFLGGDALSHPSGPAEGELIEMRRYAYGDPLRHVLWKAFARTRKLLVRTPERAVTPRPSAAAYLVAGPGDEAAASAARFFVEQGILGQDFTFCADGADAPSHDAEGALDQIVGSAAHRRAGAQGLERYMRRLSPQQRGALVLFVPAEPGPWLRRLVALAPLLGHPQMVTAVDESPSPDPRSRERLKTLLFAPDDRQAIVARRLAKVLVRLGRVGLTPQVIHKPTGALLGQAQVARLAATEGRP